MHRNIASLQQPSRCNQIIHAYNFVLRFGGQTRHPTMTLPMLTQEIQRIEPVRCWDVYDTNASKMSKRANTSYLEPNAAFEQWLWHFGCKYVERVA